MKDNWKWEILKQLYQEGNWAGKPKNLSPGFRPSLLALVARVRRKVRRGMKRIKIRQVRVPTLQDDYKEYICTTNILIRNVKVVEAEPLEALIPYLERDL